LFSHCALFAQGHPFGFASPVHSSPGTGVSGAAASVALSGPPAPARPPIELESCVPDRRSVRPQASRKANTNAAERSPIIHSWVEPLSSKRAQIGAGSTRGPVLHLLIGNILQNRRQIQAFGVAGDRGIQYATDRERRRPRREMEIASRGVDESRIVAGGRDEARRAAGAGPAAFPRCPAWRNPVDPEIEIL